MFKKLASEERGKIVGEQTFVLKDKNGKIKKLWNENFIGKLIRKFLRFELRIALLTGFYGQNMVIRNLVTNAGFAGVASRINGAGAEAAFTYLGVGTGTTAASAANTTLETEITDSGLERASATCTRSTTTQTNDTAQLDKTWTVSGTKAVTECGALNAASSGVLLGRQVFAAINVVSGDSLAVTYKFKAS
jgi:hypothetical protein